MLHTVPYKPDIVKVKIDHRFKLNQPAIDTLKAKTPVFGYDGLGSVVYYDHYSRKMADGTNERWWNTIQRCTEGTFSIVKDHSIKHDIEWNENKMQKFASKFSQYMFNMCFLPPGRGLYNNGTEFMYNRGSMALNNCAATTTVDLTEATTWTMDALMNGVGVGADTKWRGQVFKPQNFKLYDSTLVDKWMASLKDNALYDKVSAAFRSYVKTDLHLNEVTLASLNEFLTFLDTKYANINLSKLTFKSLGQNPFTKFYTETDILELDLLSLKKILAKLVHNEFGFTADDTYYIGDSREGWTRSVGLIINSFVTGCNLPDFDYSLIRNRGHELYHFGGHASGAEPLITLHRRLIGYFSIFMDMENPNLLGDHPPVVISTPIEDKSSNPIVKKVKFSEVSPNKSVEVKSNTITVNDVEFNVINSNGVKSDEVKSDEDKSDEVKSNGVKSDDVKTDESKLVDVKTDETKITADTTHSQRVFKRYFKYTQAFEGLTDENIEEWSKIENKTYGHVRLTADVINATGVCVVAGGNRRSAELLKGSANSNEFYGLKDFTFNPERAPFAWMSNNTVTLESKEQFSKNIKRITEQLRKNGNGEPGILNMLNVERYGRVNVYHGKEEMPTREMEKDNGTIPNPCGEIILNGEGEMCCLSEVMINRCVDPVTGQFSRKIFYKATQFATFYALAVSLLPTHSARTNKILEKNHRIGVSQSGQVLLLTNLGWSKTISLLSKAYKIVRQTAIKLAKKYQICEPIRCTTIKPGGTIPLLAGCPPGIHYPLVNRHIIRRMRIDKLNKICPTLINAGVKYEDDVWNKNSYVFEFPVDQGNCPSVNDVNLYQQLELCKTAQRWYSDNSVSVTITYSEQSERDRAMALLKKNNIKFDDLKLTVSADDLAIYESISSFVTNNKLTTTDLTKYCELKDRIVPSLSINDIDTIIATHMKSKAKVASIFKMINPLSSTTNSVNEDLSILLNKYTDDEDELLLKILELASTFSRTDSESFLKVFLLIRLHTNLKINKGQSSDDILQETFNNDKFVADYVRIKNELDKSQREIDQAKLVQADLNKISNVSEAELLEEVIASTLPHVKALSFLPKDNTVYQQAPYEAITFEQYTELKSKIKPINWDIYVGDDDKRDGILPKFCDGDKCELQSVRTLTSSSYDIDTEVA